MSLKLNNIGSKVALGYDSETGEAGLLLKIQVAEAVVKGNILSVSPSVNNKYIKQTNEFDTVCIAAQAGAQEAHIWAWTTGAICQVLNKDSTNSTRGWVCVADAADGRASDMDIATIGGNPQTTAHFKEIGHVKESVTGGTNKLVLIYFHTL